MALDVKYRRLLPSSPASAEEAMRSCLSERLTPVKGRDGFLSRRFLAVAPIKVLGQIMVLDRLNMTMWMEGVGGSKFEWQQICSFFFRPVAIFGGIFLNTGMYIQH